MPQLKAKRAYRERFLDNFDRSQLRREVEAVPPKRSSGLKKRYATWALGASLAVGGIGGPMKMIQHHPAGSSRAEPASATISIDEALAGDMKAAGSIARQVA